MESHRRTVLTVFCDDAPTKSPCGHLAKALSQTLPQDHRLDKRIVDWQSGAKVKLLWEPSPHNNTPPPVDRTGIQSPVVPLEIILQLDRRWLFV